MRPVELIEAVVQVGLQETPYLRCGRAGGTVVLLTLDPGVRLALTRRLAEHERVIAPVLAGGALGPGSGGAARWLTGLSEGLGLERPRVVLTPDLAGWASSLAAAGDAFGPIEVGRFEVDP